MTGISILAVLADRDAYTPHYPTHSQGFQSSRSLRTATLAGNRVRNHPGNFNPRGPCGPRHTDRGNNVNCHAISILAVLADRDEVIPYDGLNCLIFQSSRSLRTATSRSFSNSASTAYFNPRGPCGPRQAAAHRTRREDAFQSSRSLRTATYPSATADNIVEFQSSRSLRTATFQCCQTSRLGTKFQSSRSLRTATLPHPLRALRGGISILAVLADRDRRRGVSRASG